MSYVSKTSSKGQHPLNGRLWFTVLIHTTLMGMALTTGAQAQITFTDPGFVSEVVATLPAFSPVGLTFAPDGRMLIWQKEGMVRILKNGSLLPTPFINISTKVNRRQDRGLLGLALDPNFSSNGYVYLLYTYETGPDTNNAGAKTSRLTRVTADPNNPDVALPGSEIVLLGSLGTPPCSNYPVGADCIPSDSLSHSIGTIRFAPDGKMFVSTGDGASFSFVDVLALRAQNLDSYGGKILRINPDGSAPTDNPFYDGTNSIRSRIWAYGLRNPYRFGLDPVSGEPYIGDVGWNNWEEVNRGRGSNFGWPCYEGNGPHSGYQTNAATAPTCSQLPAAAVTPPLYTWAHNGSGAAAIGGSFYNGTQYPTKYRGNFFFADYPGSWIRRIVFNASNNLQSVVNFATNAGGPVSWELGPDGLFYHITFSTGEIRRIRFTRGPTAKVSANPQWGHSPLSVTFSSSGSQDPDGQPLSYLWEFGDDTTSTFADPVHTYTGSGVQVMTAKLTVTDAEGLTATDSVKITLGSVPPTATIETPADGVHVRPGDTVVFQGSATDPEDGAIPPPSLSWAVLLHHNDHIHPNIALTGTGGSFAVEDHGEGTYAYEIRLTATDSSGLTDTKIINLPVDSLPRVTSLSFNLSSVVGGTTSTGTVNISVVAPAGGLTTSLSSNNAAVQVPANVTIAAGSSSAVFTANTSVVSSATTATVTTTLNGTAQATLTVNPNSPPSVSITSPANGASFTAPANITINASASDSNGTVTQVEFFAGSTPLFTDTSSPYSFAWNNVPAGSYTLTARATDNSGGVTTSAPVNITVNVAPPPLPAPWATQDIGNPGVPGSGTYSGGTFTVKGAGADIWGNADAFRYVYQTLSGNAQIVARVGSISNTNVWAKAGVMIRQSLSANSAHAMMVITPGNGAAFQRRTSTGAASEHTSGGTAIAPYWVRLVRTGNSFSGYRSSDGSNWQLVGSATINMPTNVYIGLAVTSHNDPVLCTATFSSVAVTPIVADTGTSLKGEYYNNLDFTSLTVTRTDPQLNFDWGSGAPAPTMGANTFSVRWTGKVQPKFSETYRFYTTSDDGVRVWVNGQSIINNWTDHSPTENSGTITLAAGQKYDIRVDFYENSGGAVLKLSWSSPSQPKQIIPTSQLYVP